MISSTRSRIIIAEQSRVEWIWVSGLKRCGQRFERRKTRCNRTWHLLVMLLKCRPSEAALMDLPLQNVFMTKKLIGLGAVIAVIGSSATLFAQDGAKPANVGEGTERNTGILPVHEGTGWEACSTCQAGSLSYFDDCEILRN
jgi:hypothetical protein